MHLVGFFIRFYLLVRAHYFPNVVTVSSQQHTHILSLISYKHQRNLKIFYTLETLRFTTEVEIKIQAQALTFRLDTFGGLVVTRVRGFKPGRSRWIFRTSEKSSACLPSEGK